MSDHAALIEEAPIGTIIGWQTKWHLGIARRFEDGSSLGDWEYDGATISSSDLLTQLREATQVDVYVPRRALEAAEARTAELQEKLAAVRNLLPAKERTWVETLSRDINGDMFQRCIDADAIWAVLDLELTINSITRGQQ